MLTTKTLTETLNLLEKKEVTLTDIYTDIHKSIDKKNKELNVYVTVADAKKEVDTTLQDTPLKGIPIAVKDNYCTKGLRTTASSKVLDAFIPPYDATIVANLKKAGGTVIGKTNLDAWAHGSSTETSGYGRTLNPRNSSHLQIWLSQLWEPKLQDLFDNLQLGVELLV